jgi:hypothetical protein
MFDFFAGASPALGLWALGAAILGAALVYGVVRAGWLRPHERAELDHHTRVQQGSEDPQKSSRSTINELRATEMPDRGADKPWERPGQLGQNPDWKGPGKPDLERWKRTGTH